MSHTTTLRKTAVSLIGLVACALICAVPMWAQDQPTQTDPVGVKAPINPKFLEYFQNKGMRLQTQQAQQSSYATGYIPEPLDIESIQIPTVRGMQANDIQPNVLPSSYDLRNIVNKVPPIRNQGSCGSCWAFGAMGSLESCLRPTYQIHGSENNVKNCNGWAWGCCDGGNNTISSGYFVAWKGPVDIADDPYDGYTVDCTCHSGLTVRYHAQKVIFLADGKSNDAAVKQAIIDHGAVAVCFSAGTNNDWNGSTGAHYSTAGPGDSGYENHIVTIIGWDDNYSKSNFVITPPNNGAWLIRNSWGDWGPLHGYCWNSYDDQACQHARMQIMGETPDNYNAIYQYDPMGWINSYGYGSTTGWFANVFTASAADHLTAVGWWSASTSSTYQIQVYVNPNSGPINTSGPVLTQTGSLPDRGYDTVKLNTSIQLEQGMKFSVVVKLTTPGSNSPIPVENKVPGYLDTPTASAGQSYMSSSGGSWTDCTSVYNNGNVCLKAYTNAGRITCENPVCSPDTGTYYDNTTVTVTSPTVGATMHYTLNGVDPTEADTVIASGGTILIDKTETLKVTAFKSGMNPSLVESAAYSLKAMTPVCNPPAGYYAYGTYASAFCSSTGTTVRYTTNGLDPKSTDPVLGASVPITRNCTFKAKAFKTNWTTSDTASMAYTVCQAWDAYGAKQMGDNSSVRCVSVVTRVFPDFFYLETDDRLAGMRVNYPDSGLSPGMRIGAVGQTSTSGGERCVNATTIYVTGSGTIAPFGMRIADLGGIDWLYDSTTGAGQKGLIGGRSPNNLGFLVRLSGTYSAADPPSANRFRLTDASGSVDCVVPAGLTQNPDWQALTVTGISACESDGLGGVRKVVYVAGQEDILSMKGGTISGRVATPAGVVALNQSIESPHPYPDNSTLYTGFSGPASTTRIRGHFYETYLEATNDWLRVRDGNDNTIQTINGTGSPTMDYWTPWATGDTLKVRLYSDYANDFYGYKIDQFECDTTGIPAAGATVTLSPGGKTTTTRGDGTYSFEGLASGDYTVSVALPGATFAPPSQPVSLASDQRVTNADFVASTSGGCLSGRITNGASIDNPMLVESPHPYTANYKNTWTVTAPANATRVRVHFVQTELESMADFLYVRDGDGAGVQVLFNSSVTYDTWSNWVNGNVLQLYLQTNGVNNKFGFLVDKYEYQVQNPVGGVTVNLSPGGLSTVTNEDGGYVFYGLGSGDYTVTPSLTDATFTPDSRTVTVTAPEVEGGASFTKN